MVTPATCNLLSSMAISGNMIILMFTDSQDTAHVQK